MQEQVNKTIIEQSFFKKLYRQPAEISSKRELFTPLLAIILYFLIQTVVVSIMIIPYFLTNVAHTVTNTNSNTIMDNSVYQEALKSLLNSNSGFFTQVSIIYSLLQIGIFYFIIKNRQKKYGAQNYAPLKFEQLTTPNLLHSASFIFISLGLTVAYFLFLNFLAQNSQYFNQLLTAYQSIANLIASQGVNVILRIISIAILVPIAEELLFRGIIQNSFAKVFGQGKSIIITGIIFAIFHGNIIQSTYVLLVGLFISYVYAATNSLSIAIFMHMIYNFIGGILSTILVNNPIFDLFILALTIISIIFIKQTHHYFQKMFEKNWHNSEQIDKLDAK